MGITGHGACVSGSSIVPFRYSGRNPLGKEVSPIAMLTILNLIIKQSIVNKFP